MQGMLSCDNEEQKLDVHRHRSMTEECGRAVIRQSRQLRSIFLHGYGWEGIDILQQAAVHCPRLQLRSLCGSRPALRITGVQAVDERCSNLQQVWLNDCRQATDEAVKILARNCQELQLLSLIGTGCRQRTCIAAVSEH